MEDDRKQSGLSRRAVLAGTAAAGAAAVVGGCKYGTQLFLLRCPPRPKSQAPNWGGSRVISYRPLGRTGFEMSDISFGCAGLSDPAVARRAVERGINYFDTSPDYSGRGIEQALGEGIAGRRATSSSSSRSSAPPTATCASDTPVARRHRGGRGEPEAPRHRLPRLVHIHAVNSIDRLMAPTIHEAFDRLKEQPARCASSASRSHTPESRNGHAPRRRQRSLRRHHGGLQLQELAGSDHHLPRRASDAASAWWR